jgi:hypothetical protein
VWRQNLLDAGDIGHRVALLGVLWTLLRASLGGFLCLRSGREQADMGAMDPFRSSVGHALAEIGVDAIESEVACERRNPSLELMGRVVALGLEQGFQPANEDRQGEVRPSEP